MSLKHLDSRDEEEGDALAVEVLTHAADKSVTIVVVSSLTDVAKWLRNHEELFVQKVQSVVILTPTPTPTPTRTLTPTPRLRRAPTSGRVARGAPVQAAATASTRSKRTSGSCWR